MKVLKVGENVLVFSFLDLDALLSNVGVIIGKRSIFIIDTFLGPNIMKSVMKYLKKVAKGKNIIVFNSHADWDHHWGNCFFKDALIISHEETRSKIILEGKDDLVKNSKYKRGDVKVTPPTLVFKNRLSFPAEGVLFFHTPGHTSDSSSCFYENERILFSGDNIEYPLPFISSRNLDGYIKTLEGYLQMNVNHVVPGHGITLANKELIRKNLDYLLSFKGKGFFKPQNSVEKATHEENLNFLRKKS
ncbi:MAG: MBL fold metallo-hydrolase [Promethearchaeota archaeon]